MKDYIIFTDSCSDLSNEERTKNGIRYYQMHIVLDGAEERPADLDWKDYSVEEFYSWMEQGRKLKTTQVPVNEYIEKSKEVLKEEKDILYISCSGALSGSINVFKLAKAQLEIEFPKAKIIGIDSLCASGGLGYMVLMANENKNKGMSIEDNAKWVSENRNKFNQFCTVDTLKYLKEAGRVKASSAFFGDIIGVKPIIVSDKNGNNLAVNKVKGTKASLNAVFEGVKNTIDINASNLVRIVHANCLDKALLLKKRFEEELHCQVEIDIIGPIIGISVGPGTVAAYCYGKEITICEENLNKK